MTQSSFFYPSMIKMVINLKDKDNTIHKQVRDCKMFWTQVKKSFNLLYMYNFIEIQEEIGMRKYRLTEDGKKLRDILCVAHSLINNNRFKLKIQMYGYKNKEEMIQDVKKDLVTTEAISATTALSA